MENSNSLFSFMDFSPFNLPVPLHFGKLKATTKFARIEELGDGTSSLVYKAKSVETNKIVALKYLKQTELTSVLPREVFREVAILKSSDHENIVKLLEVVTGTGSNSLCLVLEYCPVSLTKYINNYPGEIPHSQVKCIAKQMFMGLDYLHKNLIIHRDLKTGNLMISESGILKIIDFGLSKRFTYDKNNIMTPEVFTLWYQPPEILLQSATYGFEADLWAAGCVLGEILQKRPLFKGESQISQICLIIDLIGTPTPNIWPGFSDCKVPRSIRLKDQPFNKLEEHFRGLNCLDACDEILSKLLIYNPSERISAEECLEKDWFEKAPFPAKTIDISESMINKVPRIMPNSSDCLVQR